MRNSIFLLAAAFFFLQTDAFLLSTSSFLSTRSDAGGHPTLATTLRSKVAETDIATHPTNEVEIVSSSKPIIGTVGFLLPSVKADSIPSKFGQYSPVDEPSLLEAARHLAKKAFWFSEGQVETVIQTFNDDGVMERLESVDVLIALGLESDADLNAAKELFARRKQQGSMRQCQFALECSEQLGQFCGPYNSYSPTLARSVLPWTDEASGKRLMVQMEELFQKWTSDDFALALMLFFDRFSGSSVDWVKDSIDATWEKGPVRNAQELYSMATKCGDCIGRCVQDEKCKECLDKLTELDTRDQATSYRTIVSYESELLKDFSYCILQKNNIFGCNAKIPTEPKVKPLASWRGKPLTKESARSILIAHLDDEKAPEGGLKTDISWKVACGANVAYDQFPSQNQIFYESANGSSMWYDPVFRVETLDGRNVWCKRHYKVRDGPEVGTFRLSVLDNGVTSNEFWTIVGCADDLSWIVFHYAGAATAVGQRYLGGLLCTPDGSLPSKAELPEIWKVLQSAGIEPWELYVVDNNENAPGAVAAGKPPLDFYRNDVLAAKSK